MQNSDLEIVAGLTRPLTFPLALLLWVSSQGKGWDRVGCPVPGWGTEGPKIWWVRRIESLVECPPMHHSWNSLICTPLQNNNVLFCFCQVDLPHWSTMQIFVKTIRGKMCIKYLAYSKSAQLAKHTRFCSLHFISTVKFIINISW